MQLQGIYPVLIIILVHLERSYIEPTSTASASHPPHPSQFTTSVGSRPWWGNQRPVSTTQRSHPIEVNVHELREMHLGSPSKSVTDSDADYVLTKERVETKFSDTVV